MKKRQRKLFGVRIAVLLIVLLLLALTRFFYAYVEAGPVFVYAGADGLDVHCYAERGPWPWGIELGRRSCINERDFFRWGESGEGESYAARFVFVAIPWPHLVLSAGVVVSFAFALSLRRGSITNGFPVERRGKNGEANQLHS